jgi:hypothetical protein
MNFFVLTTAQGDLAQNLHHDDHCVIRPRAIDADDPGIGINANVGSVEFLLGANVPLVGMHVAPERIIHDPTYQEHAPELVMFLHTMPICNLDPTVIFTPTLDLD